LARTSDAQGRYVVKKKVDLVVDQRESLLLGAVSVLGSS